ncbi:predicted protein [Postia placenta Mad-698-R]|nr:predicted protein [Postia placenta Mad-698-R]
MTRATLCFCFCVCFCFPFGALCGPSRHVKLSDQRRGLITAVANAPTAALGLISPASSLVTSPTANPPYSLLLQVSFLTLLICYGRRQRQHPVGHFLPAFRLPRTRLYVRRPSQQSSGRGGVGNIRRTSIDPNSPKTPNFNPEDDVTMNRGREPAQSGDKDRGGGSPHMRELCSVIRDNPRSGMCVLVSEGYSNDMLVLGRGSSLRFSHSFPVPHYALRECSDVSDSQALTTGRGGAGNIYSSSMARLISRVARPEDHPQTASLLADREAAEAEYERSVIRASEEAAKARKQSSGRGGAGNIARSQSKGPRSKSKSFSKARRSFSKSRRSKSQHTGRGGAGNIFRTRSRSESKNRSNSRGRTGLGQIWQRVRSKSRAPREHEAIALDRQLQDMTISEANTSRESMQVPQGSQAGASGDPPQSGQE